LESGLEQLRDGFSKKRLSCEEGGITAGSVQKKHRDPRIIVNRRSDKGFERAEIWGKTLGGYQQQGGK